MNRFRSNNNQYLIQGLFLETSYDDVSNVLYSLKNEDYEYQGKLYPSLKKLYLNLNDPTEYLVATQLFDGLLHWEKVSTSSNPYIQAAVREMRDELALRVQSQALASIMKDAASGSRSAAQSNRFLLSKGWLPKDRVGRPSKEDIRRRAQELFKASQVVDEDFERINSGTSGTLTVS